MRLTNDSVNGGNLIQRAIDDVRISLEKDIQASREDLIGTIQTFCHEQLAEKYLPCDGRMLNKAEYPALFNKIGTTFGGDEEDTFGIPDLRGFFIRGASDEVGIGTEQDDMMRRIKGDISGFVESTNLISSNGALFASGSGHRGQSGYDSSNAKMYFDSAVGVEGQEGTSSPNVGDETRPKNVSLMFAIRVKQ